MSDTFYIKLRYRGRLKNPPDVRQLILETEDICRSHGWAYQVLDENWSQPLRLSSSFTGDALVFEGHAPLKGICFQIWESETLSLTFLPDGTLHSLLTLTNPSFFGDDADFPWQRVKTGYDGAATHLAVCKLFRYLSGKYFEVFEVQDESGYWRHGDDARLTNWLDNLNHDRQLLEEELEAIEADETLSPQQKRDMAFRLLKGFGQKYPAAET